MNSPKFEDLEIYKRAVKLRQEIYALATKFPKEEKFRLADQLIRGTRKCPANIAEGYGRYHYQENIQFCRIARGSLLETLDHLSCAEECGFINESELRYFREKVLTLMKMLNGYINYIKKQKRDTN